MIIHDGKTILSPLSIESGEHILFSGCEITGDTGTAQAMIMAMNYAVMEFEYCRFHHITGAVVAGQATGGAVVLRSTKPSLKTKFRHCTFDDIQGNGIMAKSGNHGIEITDENIFNEAGWDGLSHPIYMIAGDSLIENNIINGTRGNAISIRNSGIVRGNNVKDAAGSAVKYYSDALKIGASNLLVIEDNICSLSGENDIVLKYGGSPMVGRYVVKGNKNPLGKEIPFTIQLS